jgi:hypothetical protein
MPLNRAVIIGKVTSAGPKLTYAENGTPTCSFWLEVTELGKDGKLRYKSAGVTKDGKKAGGVVVTSWYITKAQGATAPAPGRGLRERIIWTSTARKTLTSPTSRSRLWPWSSHWWRNMAVFVRHGAQLN